MSPTVVNRRIDGFAAVILGDDRLEACFIPELGGRLVSLRTVGGREWMYHPGPTLRLWRNRPGDGFAASTHAGLDECLPTVGPCRIADRDLPDHGACWNVPWTLDALAAERSEVALALDLPEMPLHLERRARLEDGSLRLEYRLTNRGAHPEPWGWAFHGLLALAAGDRLELPPEVRSLALECQLLPEDIPGPRWAWPTPRADVRLDHLDLGGDGRYAKLMAGPLHLGRVVIHAQDGQRLTVAWDAADHPWCGLWLTRGGYLDQHCVAVEPTNLPHDRLADALDSAPRLAPGASARWWVALTPE